MTKPIDYRTVPDGSYVVRIDDVRKSLTRSGDPRWSLLLVVDDGEHRGRIAAWDSIVFSHRGIARARRVFEALRLPKDGAVTVAPEDLIGRRAWIEVRAVRFGDCLRNEVPFAGWRRIDG